MTCQAFCNLKLSPSWVADCSSYSSFQVSCSDWMWSNKFASQNLPSAASSAPNLIFGLRARSKETISEPSDSRTAFWVASASLLGYFINYTVPFCPVNRSHQSHSLSATETSFLRTSVVNHWGHSSLSHSIARKITQLFLLHVNSFVVHFAGVISFNPLHIPWFEWYYFFFLFSAQHSGPLKKFKESINFKFKTHSWIRKEI